MKQRAFQAAAIIAVLAAVFAVLYIAAGLWDDSTVMIDNKTYSTGDRSLTLVLLTEDGLEDIGRFDRLESLDIMPYKVSARLAVEADKYISPEDAAKAMQQIDELYGGCTDIADIGFLAQSDLHGTLKSLDLSYCAVGDISVLSDFTALETLDISHTNVTDLTPLLQLSSLRSVSFAGTGIDKSSLTAFEDRGFECVYDDDTPFPVGIKRE